jgi:hypothetical protein
MIQLPVLGCHGGSEILPLTSEPAFLCSQLRRSIKSYPPENADQVTLEPWPEMVIG